MVIVTHKTSLLPLVQRLIVVAGHRIVLDGPRDEVLESLRKPHVAQPPAGSQA
jgi:ATP-binding cassette subfamily C protein LapB